MKEIGFTITPNTVFDQHIKELSGSELKVLLVIIRQTYGWIDKKNKGRKLRDRISQSQFINKTGLSRKAVSKAIASLLDKNLIIVTDYMGIALTKNLQRKGKSYLYYSFHMSYPQVNTNQSTFYPKPEYKRGYNKINLNKINNKERLAERELQLKSMTELISERPNLSNKHDKGPPK